MLIVIFLSGCAPASYKYHRPSAIDGSLVNKGHFLGPGNAIILKNKEFDIEVRYTGYMQFQLVIPEGKVLYLKEPFLLSISKSEDLNKKYDIEFMRFNDGKKTKKLVGFERTNFIQRNGSNYIASVEVGKAPDVFSIQLPTFTTGTNDFIEFPDVTFTKSSGWVITPIN